MRPWRTRIALLAAALACLAPASALAQSAGDDQYEDPFADEQSQSQAKPKAKARPRMQAAQGEEEPLTDEPPTTLGGGSGGGDGGDGGAAPQATGAGAELARTGAETGLIGLTGLGLLCCGIGLRLRLRPRELSG